MVTNMLMIADELTVMRSEKMGPNVLQTQQAEWELVATRQTSMATLGEKQED